MRGHDMESPHAISEAIAAIGRVHTVPTLLKVLCECAMDTKP